ncbi:hypothetical protein BOVA713_145 [Bacteroides ovatus]|nr:hypothetical protein BOVA713_145 [Bacteroides ovatus]
MSQEAHLQNFLKVGRMNKEADHCMNYRTMQYVYIVDYQQYSALKGTTNRLASV